ncbi:unnamed protein product [Pylaiella littoralis]
MSSLLSSIAKRAPNALGLLAGSGAGARATRTRSIRLLSAWTVSGPHHGKDSSSPSSALAPAAAAAAISVAPGSVYLRQQRRFLSIQSDDTEEGSAAAAAAADTADSAVEYSAEGEGQAAEESVEEEAAAEEEGQKPFYLIQADGLPFAIQQDEIEGWFAEAGCNAKKVTVPLWPESSMRAGQNKGRAFLEFDNMEDMQAALALSGRSIGERWINVSRLSIPLDKTCVVTIKGLQGVPENRVFAIFEEAVGIAPLSVKVIENPNRTRGLAFVTFETPEQARAAIVLDGSNIHEQWVDVSLHVPKESFKDFSLGPNSEPPFGTGVPDELVVVLTGLPFSLLEDEIKAFLANHNIDDEDIVAMNVPKYNETQFNTGIAMFHLKTEEAVSLALKLKGTYIGDRWVDISRWDERSAPNERTSHKSRLEATKFKVPAALREKHPSLPVVCVSGLPFDKTEAEVIEFFDTNGVPRSAMLEVEMPLFMQTERNTGSCWLVIDDESAYNTLMELNGAAIDDRWVTIVDA